VYFNNQAYVGSQSGSGAQEIASLYFFLGAQN
jgi:hypothetical protein